MWKRIKVCSEVVVRFFWLTAVSLDVERIKVCSEVVVRFFWFTAVSLDVEEIKVCSEVFSVYSSILGFGRESRFVVRL